MAVMMTCKRVLGSLVAAAVVTATVTVAAQAAGPKPASDYAGQASKAVDYVNAHRAEVATGGLGPQLDGVLALVASGRKDNATMTTLGTLKANIKTQGPAYCTPHTVGGCAKVTITLLAAGESPTYGGVDYAAPVTSLSAAAVHEHPYNLALDMIALERLGKPIPNALFTAVTTSDWEDPDTAGLMLVALSHVVATTAQQKTITTVVTKLQGFLDTARRGQGWSDWPHDQANVSTTSLVAAGLHRLGDPSHLKQATLAQNWLASLQRSDGAFPWWDPTWATLKVIPVLRGVQSLDTIGAHRARTVPVEGWVPPRRLVKMTVLGDSYSAGNGTLRDYEYPTDHSYRSPKNYGSVLTRRLNREFGVDTTFQTDVRAWSGAQITTGDHSIVSQADGMDPHTHVVLMTAGGNDLDFIGVVEKCFLVKIWAMASCGDAVDASPQED